MDFLAIRVTMLRMTGAETVELTDTVEGRA